MNRRKPNCGICGELKVENKKGTRLICKSCARKYAKEYHHRKEKKPMTDNQRKAKKDYRNKIRPTGLTNSQVLGIKSKYGIGEGTYFKILQKSKGRCAICKKYDPDKLVIDHNHTTKKIRGMLCRSCNIGIGMLYEDIEVFNEAINYLNKDKI